MPVLWNTRFRPTLECLEARDVPSAGFDLGPIQPSTVTALVQQIQTQPQTQINLQGIVNNLAIGNPSSPGVVNNGVVDVTEQVKATLQDAIKAHVPNTLGTFPVVGEVSLDKVTVTRVTLDKDGNFNGVGSITFKYDLGGTQYATINATITNNQLKLDSDNFLVKQFGKLDQRAQEIQPFLNTALDQLRTDLMPQYFPTTAKN